jgi:tRNA (cytidine/uridine-2'-O-)-methyltransferase
MINIVLVEPEIPPNTGNIARSCAATGSTLHLIEPLGFSIDDARVKRAGLDYWPFVTIIMYRSLAEFLEINGDKSLYFASTKGRSRYTDMAYEEDCFILFGKETKGLPESLLEAHADRTIRIPMCRDESLRSLNLANSVNIVLFEALRQNGFKGLY